MLEKRNICIVSIGTTNEVIILAAHRLGSKRKQNDLNYDVSTIISRLLGNIIFDSSRLTKD